MPAALFGLSIDTESDNHASAYPTPLHLAPTALASAKRELPAVRR